MYVYVLNRLVVIYGGCWVGRWCCLISWVYCGRKFDIFVLSMGVVFVGKKWVWFNYICYDMGGWCVKRL